MRKLVTIREIDAVLPHPNADRLALAIIGGWQCVVKKGDFRSGDLCVFFEIDSLLPIRPEFEFLRQYSYVQKEWLKSETNPEGEGYRLRTIKLRKEISQGLVLPIPEDDEFIQRAIREEALDIEDGLFELDFSDHFGVTKYDPPEKILSARMGGRPRGGFPSFIFKTDQERIQNINYRQLAESIKLAESFEVTQKMDGSSLTVFYLHQESPFADEKYNGLGICSRNIYLKHQTEEGSPEIDNVFIKSVFESNLHIAIEKVAKHLGYDIAVQGELIGEGIQDNLHNIVGYEIHVFDIFNITKQKYLLPAERNEVFNILYNFGFIGYHVNVLSFGLTYGANINHIWHSVKDPESIEPSPEEMTKIRHMILEQAEWDLAHGKPNEGIVFKSLNRDFSFKAVSNSYLLYKD
jgi:RNA ligase (TIGR02306 family)